MANACERVGGACRAARRMARKTLQRRERLVRQMHAASSAFSSSRRAISSGVRPPLATSRPSAIAASMWAASAVRSPSAGECGRPSPAAAVARRAARGRRAPRPAASGAPKARASRFCQPRGRPSAASTASNTAWSPSVTTSGWPGSASVEQRVRHRPASARRRAAVSVVAEILDAGLEEFVAALAALAEHLAEIGIAARRAGLAGDVVEADGDGEFGPQAQRLRRSRSRSGRCGGADPRRPCRGTDRPAGGPARRRPRRRARRRGSRMSGAMAG